VTLVKENPTHLEAPPINVLFEEAHRRRQRRWVIGLSLSLVLTVTAATTLALLHPGRSATTVDHRQRPPATPVSAATTPGVAWIDYDAQLHVGNPITGTQRVVATNTGASPVTPMVEANGRVYWVDTRRTFSPQSGYALPTVHDFNLDNGQVGNDGTGQLVFLSADKRDLMIYRTASDLSEVPIGRSGPTRQFTIPFGWALSGGAGYALPAAVANGFVVERPSGQPGVFTFGIWDPSGGRIRVIGNEWGIIDTYTPPGGHSSLLALVPAHCGFDRACPIKIITSTTLAAVTVHDPLPYGFDVGGAFSADGRRLAVFVKTNSGAVNPTMQMAVVTTRTGALHVVKGARSNIGESVGWAQWLPGDRTIIGGALADTNFSSTAFLDNHYLVSAGTLAAQPFTLIANRDLDVNFSAVAFSSPH
jgi:hypothetical protein